jgi:hypothetical protein
MEEFVAFEQAGSALRQHRGHAEGGAVEMHLVGLSPRSSL